MVFLPGASGDREFWRPVAQRLPDQWEMVLLNWPGAGNQPHDPSVLGADDLVTRAAKHLDGSVDIVAQSMGGVIAVRLALTRPESVRRLVSWRPPAASTSAPSEGLTGERSISATSPRPRTGLFRSNPI